MKTTEILIAEHERIMDCIQDFSCHLNKLQTKDFTVSLKFIEFVKEFVDKFHHAKEEELYFKWMLEQKPELEHGPLKCMLSEHEQGRDLIRNASEAIEVGDLNGMKEAFNQFIEVLTSHIQKENTVLYQMAESIDQVTKNGDEQMLSGFEKINTDLASISKSFEDIDFSAAV